MRFSFQSFRLLKQLLFSLFNFKPSLTLYTFTLITLKSMSAGLTFLMILPLLECLGLSNHATTTHVPKWFYALFDFLHLPRTLLIMLCIFTLIMGMTAYIAYLEQQASTMLQQQYNQFLRTHLQRTLLFSNWSFLRTQKKSDLIHVVISETHNLAICNHQLLLLINQIFLIGVNTLIAFYLNWSVTLFAVGVASLLFMVMVPLHKKILSAGAEHLKANQELHQVISQQLSSIKAIKGSGYEVSSAEAFEKTGQTLERLSTRFNLTIARNRFNYAICSAVTFSLLLYVAIQVFAVPIQQLVILLIIYARILPLVTNAQQIYQRVLHQLPAYQHIRQLLTEAQQHQEVVHTSAVISFDQMINVHNISYKYPKARRWVIQQMSIQLKKNTSTLVLGRSGVGKTTLIDLICGLSVPSQGQIWIDNTLLTVNNAHAWRRQVTYITQDSFLFNATVRENLLWFSPNQSLSDMYYALELAAADFVYDLPDGLDTLLGENGITLSGGERQRLILARAIIQKPKLLILDESTNSLDAERVSYIQQSLATLKGILTILMISHQKMNMQMIDQVIYLEHSNRIYEKH